MSYLSLSNPTTDSCDFRVKLSNDFNTDYYRELRITGRDYGSSTDRVSSYVESRTARSSYYSRYVEGEVNDGMSSGHTYTLYAYAQARNGTWYKAGEDTITMEGGGSSRFDLGIREILYRYEDSSDDYEEVEDGMNFEVGREIKFKVPIKNYKDTDSPEYTVVVYDENGYKLDDDEEGTLDGRDTDNAYLYVTVNQSGEQRLKFVIESNEGYDTDDDDNVEYKTVRFGGGSGNIAKQLNDGVINNEYMSSGLRGQWFKVRFNNDGLANFWINSAGLSNDLDLYVYETQDTEGRKLGSSTHSSGAGKDDDIVRDIPVISGREYYIYVKNYGGDSCYYQIKAKNYPIIIPIVSAPTTEEVYEGGFKVVWPSAQNATKYRLKVRREYDSYTTYYETSNTSYSIPSGSLQYGVTHFVSVQAGNNYKWSNYSSENKLTTRAKHPTLQVIKKTSNSININASGLLSNNEGVRGEIYDPTGRLIDTRITEKDGGDMVFDNLISDTTYKIKAKTLYTISGVDRGSDYVELSERTETMQIPSAPQAEEVYEGGFKVSWGNVENATKYRLKVRREYDSHTTDYETSSTNYSIPSGSLQYGVTYFVSVQAGKDQEWSDYSNENPLTTRAKHPTLKVIEKTSNYIKVNMSGLSGNNEGVRGEIYDPTGRLIDTRITEKDGGDMVFDNLISDTTYKIKAKTVFTISGVDRGSDYVELSERTEKMLFTSIPSAPKAEEVYEGGFKVSWGSVENATKYRLKVRREYDSHTTDYETSSTSYSIPSGSLQYGVTHFVSVQAGKDQEWSNYSSENKLTTRAKHPTLQVIEKTSDSINVRINGLLSNNDGVIVEIYNPDSELVKRKTTKKDGGDIVFIGLRGDTQYTIKAKTLFTISGVDRGSDYVELSERTDIAPIGILKEIKDNIVYNEIMDSSEEGEWYKVKFNRNGKANFWINSVELDNNLDLYIYENQDLESTILGQSTQHTGNNQADDMVLDLDVLAGEYYYIYVKNYDGGSCDFKIKTRLQPKEIKDDTVYNESINESEKGKWYKVKFDRNGKANFWINSAELDNNLDLYIYEAQDLDSTVLGQSTQSDNQTDDMILDLNVRAGVYYYIYVKNCDGGSCDFQIKSKIQAKEIQNSTVYDENMSSNDKGKWYKVKFDRNGKANFWINSRELDNNLDLYIYENQDLKSTKLGESTQLDNQADDMVLDLDVRAGVCYYIYVKNEGHGSCNFKIKAKLQEEIPSGEGGDIIPRKYYVNQGDYSDIKLGSSGKYVNNSGCYISSIATIICWHLKDDKAETKRALISKMAINCDSDASYLNKPVTHNGRTFKIDINRTNVKSNMIERIQERVPIICQISGHFVVVNGYDENKTGWDKFSVLDPGRAAAKTLKDAMSYRNHGHTPLSNRVVSEVGGSKPPTAGKPTPGGYMNVSEKYIDFVKDYEVFKSNPYRGEDSQNLTIGYGHVIKPGEHFGIITEPEAVELLKKDLKVRIDYVNRKIKEDNLTLNQHQFDALVDFRYNKGAALSTEPGVCTLYRLIAKEKVMSGEKLMNAFLMWHKVGDKFNKGVYRRSYDEGEMFIKGDYTRNYPEKP